MRAPLAGVCLLLASCSAGAGIERHRNSSPGGRIMVHVLGKDGQVPDYEVRLRREHITVAEARTLVGGPVLFHVMEPGEYSVRVQGPGLDERKTVWVKDASTSSLTWVLKDGVAPHRTGKTPRFLAELPDRLIDWIIRGLFKDRGDRESRRESPAKR